MMRQTDVLYELGDEIACLKVNTPAYSKLPFLELVFTSLVHRCLSPWRSSSICFLNHPCRKKELLDSGKAPAFVGVDICSTTLTEVCLPDMLCIKKKK